MSTEDFVADCRALAAMKRPWTAARNPLTATGALCDEFYEFEGNGVGGSLHVVLDDGNIEHGNIEFCRKVAEDRGDAAGMALADLLLVLTEAERAKVLGCDDDEEDGVS